MTEIEPTIDNVREGDTVTIERGTPGEPGHQSETIRVRTDTEPTRYTRTNGALSDRVLAHGWTITRITRPTPQIPAKPGTRFWARWKSESPREYIGIIGGRFVDLTDGAMWERDMFEREHTVVPAPEPETVPVPADLLREAAARCRSLGGA